jgi:hypothetical protein
MFAGPSVLQMQPFYAMVFDMCTTGSGAIVDVAASSSTSTSLRCLGIYDNLTALPLAHAHDPARFLLTRSSVLDTITAYCGKARRRPQAELATTSVCEAKRCRYCVLSVSSLQRSDKMDILPDKFRKSAPKGPPAYRAKQ